MFYLEDDTPVEGEVETEETEEEETE